MKITLPINTKYGFIDTNIGCLFLYMGGFETTLTCTGCNDTDFRYINDEYCSDCQLMTNGFISHHADMLYRNIDYYAIGLTKSLADQEELIDLHNQYVDHVSEIQDELQTYIDYLDTSEEGVDNYLSEDTQNYYYTLRDKLNTRLSIFDEIVRQCNHLNSLINKLDKDTLVEIDECEKDLLQACTDECSNSEESCAGIYEEGQCVFEYDIEMDDEEVAVVVPDHVIAVKLDDNVFLPQFYLFDCEVNKSTLSLYDMTYMPNIMGKNIVCLGDNTNYISTIEARQNRIRLDIRYTYFWDAPLNDDTWEHAEYKKFIAKLTEGESLREWGDKHKYRILKSYDLSTLSIVPLNEYPTDEYGYFYSIEFEIKQTNPQETNYHEF